MSFDTVVWVLNHADTACPADRLVLVALASHQNGRASRPAVSRIVDETRLARSSVFRSLTRLEESKAIEVVHKGPGRGGTNLYYVHVEKVPECNQFCCKGPTVGRGGVPPRNTKVPSGDSKGPTVGPEPLKSLYEPLTARVPQGHLSKNKGPSSGPQRLSDDEPRNPLGAGKPCLGDPCPDCGEAWTLGHRCET